MEEVKKVRKTKKYYERQIETYKKNNKALCDMVALYSYCVIPDKELDPSAYIVLESVIKDLEDPDVVIPFAAKSLNDFYNQDMDNLYKVLHELKESKYYDELEGELHENYQTLKSRMYFGAKSTGRRNDIVNQRYDFIGSMSEVYPGFISEILCSNISMDKKVSILERAMLHSISRCYRQDLEYILDPNGAGSELSRTPREVKKQKMEELKSAIREYMSNNPKKVREIFHEVMSMEQPPIYKTNWLYFLQQNLIDFMNIRGNATIKRGPRKVSAVGFLGVEELNNFKKFYQLEDRKNLPNEIKYNDDMLILENIRESDLPKFITLPNYHMGLDDIEVISKRVLKYQIDRERAYPDLVDDVASAIIYKAQNKEEFAKFSKMAEIFIENSDYIKYKEEKERFEREQAEERKRKMQELKDARSELIIRLHNMNESLQDQVPGKKVIKDLRFEKNNKK